MMMNAENRNKLLCFLILICFFIITIYNTKFINLNKIGSSGVILLIYNSIAIEIANHSKSGKWISFPQREYEGTIGSRIGGFIVRVTYGENGMSAVHNRVKSQEEFASKWYNLETNSWIIPNDEEP